MNIDEELFEKIVTLYEDDIDENEVKQKLKRMTASDLIDLKNALDQENFARVDKFMDIKIEESLIKEIESISTLSGSSSQSLFEYRDLKTHEIQAVRDVVKKYDLSRKYKNVLERIIGHDVNLNQTPVISLLKRLGFAVSQAAGGIKMTGPNGNVVNAHFSHSQRKGDNRFDRGIFFHIINTLKKEDIYNPEKYEEMSPEKLKKDLTKTPWPKIEIASSNDEFENYMTSNLEEIESEAKGQEITWFPIGSTQDNKLVYAIWPKGALMNFEQARKKAKQMGVNMKKRDEQLNESKEIREIAELAGIPPIGGLRETASAGGTSAGSVATGPAGPNKPHSSSKKKKKKKKSDNPYGYSDNLIRRWQP